MKEGLILVATFPFASKKGDGAYMEGGGLCARGFTVKINILKSGTGRLNVQGGVGGGEGGLGGSGGRGMGRTAQ